MRNTIVRAAVGACFWFCGANLFAQTTPVIEGTYRAIIQRQDGIQVIFNFEFTRQNQKPVIIIRNAKERILVDKIIFDKDSIFIQMPLFESQFRVRVMPGGNWQGAWVRGTTFTEKQEVPFLAYANLDYRFEGKSLAPLRNISGRWEVVFTEGKITRPAIAEFTQSGNELAGTFLTPSGDYRYLEGRVSADSFQLSCFDGTHAYYFAGRIQNDSTISNAMFYAGTNHTESWTAIKNPDAALPEDIMAMNLKPGQERLNFTFPDLNGNMVSINDSRFRGKVVLVEIMGSWCPNCMDETAFLSDYYSHRKDSSVEIIALAYEYSTDFERSRRSLAKFRDRFQVKYPMLITGVSTSDSLRTEKTLPQLTPIKGFPTTIFIGKDGKVKKIHGGFYGPGAGEHYAESKNLIYETIDALLKERL